MWRSMLLLAVAVPAVAHADVWRWRDRSGQVHYSNVPTSVPRHADPVRAVVGYVAAARPPEPVAAEVIEESTNERRRAERRLRRRLTEIEAFYDRIRARQRARLQAYATSTLYPDWMVADHWLAVKEEEGRLRAALARLERRRDGTF